MVLPCRGLTPPLLLGAALLGYDNFIRFGHWYEFGQQYRLAAFNLRQIRDHLFSIDNVPPALYAYFLKPPELFYSFPFLRAVGGPRPTPIGFRCRAIMRLWNPSPAFSAVSRFFCSLSFH